MNRIGRRVLTLLLTGLVAVQAALPSLNVCAAEGSGTQAEIGIPEGYVESDELPMPEQGAQRNGRDSGSSANGQLVKTAEWTDYDAGEGEVNLTYAVPNQGSSTAVFAMGTCYNHNFNEQVARNQILELLDQYDYVDVLTTRCNFKKYYSYSQDYLLHDAEEVILHLASADGYEHNKAYLKEQLTVDPYPANDNATGDWIFYGGSHVTGAMLMQYLTDYLAGGNKPTAVYVSLDGSRAFGYIRNTEPNWQKSDEITLSRICYNATPSELVKMDYSTLVYDRDTIQTLADYQAMGRYYVCISSQMIYQQAYYESMLTKRFCYASFALIDPYQFVHGQDEILAYLDGKEGTKNYKEFDRVGQPIIDYSQSFAANQTKFTTAPITIQDTLADGLTLKADEIEVSITVDGEPIAQMPEVTKIIHGNSVTITLAETRVGQVVHVRLPFTIANGADHFYSDAISYADTNAGQAKAITVKGEEVTVNSPRLYKGGFRILTRVENGTITDDVTNIMAGSTETVNYSPDEGYELVSVTVDGEAVDIEAYPESYTFADIIDNHEIVVIYQKAGEPETPDPETPEPETPDPQPEKKPDPQPDPKKDDGNHGDDGGNHDDGGDSGDHQENQTTSVVTPQVVQTAVEVPVTDVVVETGEEEEIVAIPEAPVPGEGGAVSGDRNVATGDPAMTGLLLVIAGVAAVALGVYVRKGRKENS